MNLKCKRASEESARTDCMALGDDDAGMCFGFSCPHSLSNAEVGRDGQKEHIAYILIAGTGDFATREQDNSLTSCSGLIVANYSLRRV